jgi:ribonucleoside-diphosphate reductase beta chain
MARTLNRNLLPMRLWEKAKVHGVWNPATIDFTTDLVHWPTLPDRFRRRLIQLCAVFLAGEEAVSADLMPLIRVAAAEGRIEEEMFLTSFLWDEARHVDLFQRFFSAFCPELDEASKRPADVYRQMFEDELRPALERLSVDTSAESQVRASVTYHLVVEGVMAETGYHVFRRLVGAIPTLPGLRESMTLLQRDESRHIAYGLYVLSRLLVEHGELAYRALVDRINELGPLVAEATTWLVTSLEGDDNAITVGELRRVSQQAFVRRVQRVAKARTATPAQLHALGAFDQDEDVPRSSVLGSLAVGA